MQDGIKLCSPKIVESLYMMRTRESVQLQTVLVMFEQEIDQNRSMPS